MVAIIKNIQKGEKDNLGRKLLNIITFIDENCNEFTGYVTDKGLKVAEIENRLLQLGIDKNLIQDYKYAVLDEADAKL